MWEIKWRLLLRWTEYFVKKLTTLNNTALFKLRIFFLNYKDNVINFYAFKEIPKDKNLFFRIQ